MKRQSNLILKGTSIYIILALYTLFLPSCQKDVVMPIEHTETYVGKNTNADFKIKSAQAWFNNNLSTFNTVKLDTIQPMWDKALVYENRIEMPYLINGKSNRKSLDGQIERLLSKERLVMIKKGNTNDYFIFVINYFPSKESNIDINKIDISNFMTERFDGKIMISTLNKKITDMILFKEGKIIENVSALDNRNNIQLRDKRCIYYDDYNCSSQLVVDWNPTTFTITYSTRMVCEWGKFEICWDDGNCTNCIDYCAPNSPMPELCPTYDRCRNPPYECNSGACCTQTTGYSSLIELDFNDLAGTRVANATMNLNVTNVNCQSGLYGQAIIYENVQTYIEGDFYRRQENVIEFRREPIGGGNWCGSRLGLDCSGIAVYTPTFGPFAQIEFAIPWQSTAEFTFL